MALVAVAVIPKVAVSCVGCCGDVEYLLHITFP